MLPQLIVITTLTRFAQEIGRQLIGFEIVQKSGEIL